MLLQELLGACGIAKIAGQHDDPGVVADPGDGLAERITGGRTHQ
jgi:hypothetical protein